MFDLSTANGVLVANTVEQALPTKAKLYIGMISLMGAAAIGLALSGWESTDLLKFAGFLAVATLSSGIALNVPGVAGSLSLTFLFVLFGVVELSAPETVVLASLVTLTQCYWTQSSRPSLAQMAFTIATMAMAASAASAVYHAAFMETNHIDPIIRFVLATLILFLFNTIPISIAVGVAESASAFAVWRECYFWSLPYYLGGGVVAQLASIGSRVIGWPTVLLTGPLLYLIFRS